MPIAEALQALEQELLTASVRKGSACVASLLAADFREFGSSGRVFTKAEIIEALRDEAPATFQMQDFGFVPLAEGVALVTYRVTKWQNGVPASESLRSSIWRRTSDRWRMVFHQGTRV